MEKTDNDDDDDDEEEEEEEEESQSFFLPRISLCLFLECFPKSPKRLPLHFFFSYIHYDI